MVCLQHHCSSEGSAMVFRNDKQRFNYLTTRDLNLGVDLKPVHEETFDLGPLGRYSALDCLLLLNS